MTEESAPSIQAHSPDWAPIVDSRHVDDIYEGDLGPMLSVEYPFDPVPSHATARSDRNLWDMFETDNIVVSARREEKEKQMELLSTANRYAADEDVALLSRHVVSYTGGTSQEGSDESYTYLALAFAQADQKVESDPDCG